MQGLGVAVPEIEVLDLEASDMDEITTVFERVGTLESGKLGPAQHPASPQDRTRHQKTEEPEARGEKHVLRDPRCDLGDPVQPDHDQVW